VEQLIRRELKNSGPAETVIEALRKDRKSRKPTPNGSIYLRINGQSFSTMRLVENSEIPMALEKARRCLITIANKEKERSVIQRKLAAVPDRDTIQGITGAISTAPLRFSQHSRYSSYARNSLRN
jgi:hypothetical protein